MDEIKTLGESEIVITIGNSVEKCGELLKEKNENINHLHFDTISGLLKADKFYKALMDQKHITKPDPTIVRWRKRYQDALLDTHFALGGANVVIATEPDQILSIATAIKEAGANIKAVVSPSKSKSLETVECDNIIIGDFEDVENELQNADILISNFHGERLTIKYKKALMLRGFPNYEAVGNQLKNDTLYEGSTYMLFEIANIINHYKYSTKH